VLCGEQGRDTLLGGAKADILIGGPGRDILKGAAGKDQLIGGPAGIRRSRNRVSGVAGQISGRGWTTGFEPATAWTTIPADSAK
jgi:Ca2+-binding RTX toxin-like protein